MTRDNIYVYYLLTILNYNLKNMKKLIYLAIFSLLFIFNVNSLNAYTCDQIFEWKTLRYDANYKFYDVFNAWPKDVFLNTKTIHYLNPEYLDQGWNFDWTSQLKNNWFKVPKNSSMRILETWTTNWRIGKHPTVRTKANRNSYDFMVAYELSYDYSNNYPNASDDIVHTECEYYSVSWCGDWVLDAWDEICDPKDTSRTWYGNGWCDAQCKPININSSVSCDSIDLSAIKWDSPFNTTVTCNWTNANSYQILCWDGSVINSKTWQCSYTFWGWYDVSCIVNWNVTSNSCKAKVEVTWLTPLIRVQKFSWNNADLDWNISHIPTDDSQTVNKWEKAVFNILVENFWKENLKQVSLRDPLEPLCNRSDAETRAILRTVWNNDEIFNIWESFTYSCEKSNTQQGYTNKINVVWTGVNSNISVTDTDTTEVKLVQPEIRVVKVDSNINDLDWNIWNDTQLVKLSEKAVFWITATNIGTEDLNTIILNDPLEPLCNRSDTETKEILKTIWNNDEVFNVWESFTYSCEKLNTLANYTNTILITWVWVTSNDNVNDDDTTVVVLATIESWTCEAIVTGTQSWAVLSTATWLCENSWEVAVEFKENQVWNIINYTWSCREWTTIKTWGECSANYTPTIIEPGTCESNVTGVQTSEIFGTTTWLCKNAWETVVNFAEVKVWNISTYTWGCQIWNIVKTEWQCSANYSNSTTCTWNCGRSGSNAICEDILSKWNDKYTCVWSNKTTMMWIDCDWDWVYEQVKYSSNKSAFTRNNGVYEYTFTCNNPDGADLKPICAVEKHNISVNQSAWWNTSSSCKNWTQTCWNGKIEWNEECEAPIDGNWNIGSIPSFCSSSCKVKKSLFTTEPDEWEIGFVGMYDTILGHNQNLGKLDWEIYLWNNSNYTFNNTVFNGICVTTNNIGGQENTWDSLSNVWLTRHCTDINGKFYPNQKIFLEKSLVDVVADKNKVDWDNYEDNKLVVTVRTLTDTAPYAKILNWSDHMTGKFRVRVAKPAIVTTWGTSFTKAWVSSNTQKIAEENWINTENWETWVNDNDVWVWTKSSSSSTVSETNTGVVKDASSYKENSEAIDTENLSDTNWVINSISDFNDKYNGLDNIFVVRNSNVNLWDTDLNLDEATTYIIDWGNLYINWNIKANKNIAFVVKNGWNIIVWASVTEITWTYIVIPDDSNIWEIKWIASDKTLIIKGSLYGNTENLVENRYNVEENSNWELTFGTIVSFGSSVFQKPAPMVSSFVNTYLKTSKVAK